jgi:hypothetical protein
MRPEGLGELNNLNEWSKYQNMSITYSVRDQKVYMTAHIPFPALTPPPHLPAQRTSHCTQMGYLLTRFTCPGKCSVHQNMFTWKSQ